MYEYHQISMTECSIFRGQKHPPDVFYIERCSCEISQNSFSYRTHPVAASQRSANRSKTSSIKEVYRDFRRPWDNTMYPSCYIHNFFMMCRSLGTYDVRLVYIIYTCYCYFLSHTLTLHGTA